MKCVLLQTQNILDMIKFIKDWTLPLAMLLGGIAYPIFSQLGILTPWLIMAMLFLTFSKLSLSELKPEKLHIYLLIIQVFGSLAAYFLLKSVHPVIAQGAMICILAPTATAAPVITGKLGGSIASLTTFTLLSNVAVAFVAPLCFPLIEQGDHPNFISGFTLILTKVFPLLLGPFVVAQLVRGFLPKVHQQVSKIYGAGFYIWAFSLTIVTGQMVEKFIKQSHNSQIALYTALIALASCIAQFFIGKIIGERYNNRITGGQALGQKNTILAIWMAHTYLNPLSAIGPGAYVLWQNLFNSWQLWRKSKGKSV